MIKRLVLGCLLVLPFISTAQFRLVGTGVFTTINDSTYQSVINFRPDLTGNSYTPLQVNKSMFVLSQRGQLYRIDTVYNKTFSTATLVVVEKDSNWNSPIGQIMVFQSNTFLTAPQAVFGSNSSTANMQATVDTWNANLLRQLFDTKVDTIILDNYMLYTDTISLSNRINSKVDTSTLNDYVKYTDTLSSIATKTDLTFKLNSTDTVSLSNRIDTKISYSDTLSSIATKAELDLKLDAEDTLKYVKFVDTLTSIATKSDLDLKLNAVDTVKYIKYTDTITSIATKADLELKLNATDTVNYVKYVDTLSTIATKKNLTLYQPLLSLTTVGTEGQATFINDTLNIPNYADTSIYNANGTLTGNRKVITGNNTVSFTSNNADTTYTKISKNSVTVKDNVFGINNEMVLDQTSLIGKTLNSGKESRIDLVDGYVILRGDYAYNNILNDVTINPDGIVRIRESAPQDAVTITGRTTFNDITNVSIGNGIKLELGSIKADTTILSTINDDSLKLNISDTSDMLRPYLKNSVDSIVFKTTYEANATPGEMIWNSQSGTIHLGLNANVEIPIGQGEVHMVRNVTGTNIPKGSVVYISGSTGQRPQVSLANAKTEITSSVTFGVTAEEIIDNNTGFVVTSGYIKGINTSTLTEGQAIWLDTIPGKITKTKHKAPIHAVLVGYVVRAANNGTIFVKIQNGYELDELHNVLDTMKINKSVLYYDTLTNLWKASTTPGIFQADTATMLQPYLLKRDTVSLSNRINTKQDIITGAASTVTTSNLTPSSVLISNVFGKIAVSPTVDSTELSYLDGVTSAIQTQLNNKQNTLSLTTTGNSGASTLVGSTLNIPNYTLSGLGGEPAITAGTTSQYWRGDKTWQTLNTTAVTEGTNLYFTNTRARDAISLTTNNSSGAATYSGGVLNIPNYTLSGLGGLSNSTTSTQNGYFGDIFLYDDSTPSHYLGITNSANLTAARTLSVNVNDADRTVSLSGNLTVSGAATISGTNTGDQTITLTGDVTGSGTGSFGTTLANSGVAAGTYNNSATTITPFIVDAKGRITGTGSAVTIAPAFSSIASKPTTLSGYGITDAVPSSRTITINGTAQDLSADRSWNVGTVIQVNALTIGTTGTDISSTVANNTTTPTITLNIPTASATNRGALSSTDWSTFNNKQSAISLTTTGSSGSATFTSNTLNIPTYTLAGLGGISLTSLSASAPLSYNNGTGAFSITQANGSTNGFLSSTDWTTFNNKQNALGFTPANSTTTISTTSPLSGGGDLSANRTLSLASAYGDTQNPYGTKLANTVLAGPTTGSVAAPTFRSLVAADIPPSITSNTSGTASNVTGTVSPANGGTGLTTFGGANRVPYSTSASALTFDTTFRVNPTSGNFVWGNAFITGTDNISIGRGFSANKSGLGLTGNIFVGADAGYRMESSGIFNTVIGHGAGSNITNSNTNTFIGSFSGIGITGSDNIIIGYNSANSTTTGSKNILIGSSINLPTPSNSNQLAIGNILFGVNMDSTGTSIPVNGRIGIRNNNPQKTLHVDGEVRITDLDNGTANKLVGANNDGDLDSISIGSGLTLSGGTLSATSGTPGVTITSSGLSTTLTNSSNAIQIYRGDGNHTYTMPSTATTVPGKYFEFKNETVFGIDTVRVISSNFNTLLTLAPGAYGRVMVISTVDNNNTSFLVNREFILPLVYEYSTEITDQILTIPTGCKQIEIVCIGGGGGGGSGRRGIASGQTSAKGGNGGGSGAYSFATIDATGITSKLRITVGGGGTGGAARTTDNTNGLDGTNGKPSSVYTDNSGTPSNAMLVFAGGGGFGGGGASPALGTDSIGLSFFGDFIGVSGGTGIGSDGANIGLGSNKIPTGGGGGGDVTSTTAKDGGNGGAPGYGRIANNNKGTTGSVNGTAGYTPAAGQIIGGGGGGGGASRTNAAAGNGGNGTRGGGGGGGGASLNTYNSGAGGNGGVGYVRVTFY